MKAPMSADPTPIPADEDGKTAFAPMERMSEKARLAAFRYRRPSALDRRSSALPKTFVS
ncbi:MAG TPA: hypothetical protein VLS49_12060 [Usitatibacter sp.]|nr:hypothetical protein [Usitatibacter sp.]